MNTIKGIGVKGQRLYVIVNLNGLKEITIKFYNPYKHTDVYPVIEEAVNYKDFTISNNCEDEGNNCIEKHPYEELICSITSFIDNTQYSSLGITGIYDEEAFKESKIKITELGKKKFAVYSHMGLGIDSLEIGFSEEEAKFKMLQLKLGTLTWKNKLNTNHGIDRMYAYKFKDEVSNYLESMESIQELIQFKSLTEENIQTLINAGLIEGEVNNVGKHTNSQTDSLFLN